MVLSDAQFRSLVSGHRRGPLAVLARSLLWAAKFPYGAVVGWRNRAYDQGRAPITRVEVPVICVGNLTLGGTGKTPLVAWIARWARQHQVRVCVASRGYRAEEGASSDEGLQLERMLPDVPHLENRDRVAAARLAIDELEMQWIVLDDGFQHRRLGRDLDIVLLDATEPFGYGHLFPRGRLREPPSGLSRAQVVILSRADLVSPADREQVRNEVQRWAPQALWCEVAHSPTVLVNASGERVAVNQLAEQTVAAFCGIGNPEGFRQTLSGLDYRVAGLREFPDHHAYSASDVEQLIAWARPHTPAALICTEKDLVKLDVDTLGPWPLWAVAIEIEFLTGQTALEEKLRALLPPSE